MLLNGIECNDYVERLLAEASRRSRIIPATFHCVVCHEQYEIQFALQIICNNCRKQGIARRYERRCSKCEARFLTDDFSMKRCPDCYNPASTVTSRVACKRMHPLSGDAYLYQRGEPCVEWATRLIEDG